MAALTDVWAITTYYNPFSCPRRLQNFRCFRQRLGLPLCAIEHSMTGEYELCDDDADLLLRARSPDLLWQKERLLNVALDRLPRSANVVVWVDSDVVFSNRTWLRELEYKLREAAVVHCYSELVDLPADTDPDTAIGNPMPPDGVSVVWLIATRGVGVDSSELTTTRALRYESTGGAWAARRELVARHGFYDAMILGGGDRLFAYACLGMPDDAVKIARLPPVRAQHYLQWAHRVFHAVRGRVGVIEGQLLHQWHGSVDGRSCAFRHRALAQLDFDPDRDLVVDRSGAWTWSAIADTRLRDLAERYLRARHEDRELALHNDLS